MGVEHPQDWVIVAISRQAGTGQVVQSSRVAVTDAQAGAVGRLGIGVVVFGSSGKLDWARIRGALGPC